MMTADRNAETSQRSTSPYGNVNDVGEKKNSNKIISLANCCVGGAELVIGRGNMLSDKCNRDNGEILKDLSLQVVVFTFIT